VSYLLSGLGAFVLFLTLARVTEREFSNSAISAAIILFLLGPLGFVSVLICYFALFAMILPSIIERIKR
jgi:preprotein translocase subunit Sss1